MKYIFTDGLSYKMEVEMESSYEYNIQTDGQNIRPTAVEAAACRVISKFSYTIYTVFTSTMQTVFNFTI